MSTKSKVWWVIGGILIVKLFRVDLADARQEK